MARSDPQLVHPIATAEVPGWSAAMHTTFLEDPESRSAAAGAAALARTWDPERAWGARDHGRWVATLRTGPRMLTVPGSGTGTEDLAVDTVTNVTVSATHRRRGLMSGMLNGALAEARERGDAASILIAAEWPIYGRFGYAPAIQAAHYTLRLSRPGSQIAGDVSRVRQVDRATFADVAPAAFAAFRRLRAGQIDRNQSWWDRRLGRDGYTEAKDLSHNWLIHEGDDGVDGYLGWRSDGDWSLVPPYGTAEVWEICATTPEAYRDLWAYLSGLDILDELTFRYRPVDEPVRWLLSDGRTLVTTQVCDLMWLRLLDVPAALSARRYAVDGELVLEVRDDADSGGFAAGRYRLAADDGGVSCERAPRATADITLDQRVLAAIYLGGFTPFELRIAGGIAEHSAGALSRLSAMFAAALAPWNATWF